MPTHDSTLCVVDETLFMDLLQEVRPIVFSYRLSLGTDGEELMQDVAERLLRYWKQVSTSKNPYAYARVLARNVMLALYEKIARRRRIAPLVSLHALEEMGVQF
jgi:DNA-directed RNA polymerase specialized sigma24 family protein